MGDGHLIIPQIVTVEVLYLMPDFQHIVQVFVWQTKDTVPDLPRVNKFIDFWHGNLDGSIVEWFAHLQDGLRYVDHRFDHGTLH